MNGARVIRIMFRIAGNFMQSNNIIEMSKLQVELLPFIIRCIH